MEIAINFYVLSTALILICCFFIFKSKKKRLPPGPMGLPFIGNLLQVDMTDFTPNLNRFAKKFGDIFSLKFGNLTYIVINGAENIDEIFKKRGEEFSARPKSFLFDHLNNNSGIVSSSGSTWKQHRTFALKVLRSFGFGGKSLEKQIREEIDLCLEKLNKTQGQPVDITLDVKNCLSNVMSGIVFGKHFDANDQDFQFLVHAEELSLENIHNAALMDVVPLAKYLPGDIFKIKEINFNNEQYFKIMQKYIDEHKRTFDENDIRDFIDYYLKALHDDNSNYTTLSEEQLKFCISDFFVTGTESTSVAIRWAVLLLLHYPDIQNRLFDEIDSVVGSNRLPCLNDRGKLSLVEAFLLEVFRYASVVPFVPHGVAEDTIYKGFIIPTDAHIIPNFFSVHMDEKIFPNCHIFDPSRFIDEQGMFCGSKYVLPFGVGMRACPGDVLANAEFFLFMTSLLQQFRLEPMDWRNVPSLKSKLGITREPLPFCLKLIQRHI